MLFAALAHIYSCEISLKASLDKEHPIVLVHETDRSHGGVSLEQLHAQCPEELLTRVFTSSHPIVEWQRINHFQLVSLRLIGEGLITSHPLLFIAGAISEQPLALPRTPLYASPHNPAAATLLDELQGLAAGGGGAAGALATL